jgi:hypothetical protein
MKRDIALQQQHYADDITIGGVCLPRTEQKRAQGQINCEKYVHLGMKLPDLNAIGLFDQFATAQTTQGGMSPPCVYKAAISIAYLLW